MSLPPNAAGRVRIKQDVYKRQGYAYAVNGKSGTLAAISLAELEKGAQIQMLEANTIDVKHLVQDSGGVYGDMTSVAISPDGQTLAAAVQASDYTERGLVLLFTCEADGTLTFRQAVETGVQPDMVTFCLLYTSKQRPLESES